MLVILASAMLPLDSWMLCSVMKLLLRLSLVLVLSGWVITKPPPTIFLEGPDTDPSDKIHVVDLSLRSIVLA